MELIEKLQKIIEREIDNVPMVLTDPLTLRRLRAERLAQAALTALIEHAGQDGATEGDRSAAIEALNAAERQRSFGGNGTVLSQVRDIFARHRQAAIKERDAQIVAWLLNVYDTGSVDGLICRSDGAEDLLRMLGEVR